MSFIVQQPHSNTNPTNKFRVADSADLMRFINGATKSYAYLEFDSYQEAETARDIANVDLARGEKPF